MTEEKRQLLRRQHKELLEKLSEMEEPYEETIAKVIAAYIKDYPKNWANGVDELIDIFYEELTETISITIKEIKNIYTRIKDFDIKDVFDLTYNADGQTLKARIQKHWDQTEEALNKLDKNKFDIRDQLLRQILKILDNETKIVQNKVIKNKVEPLADIIVIEGDGTDECSDWFGEHPVGEVELPPYHPGCTCSFYYDQTDDPDDFQDLDLEPNA